MQGLATGVPDWRPGIAPDQEPVGLAELADRLVRATTIVPVVVGIVLLAALALDRTPVFGPSVELAPDPAVDLPF